MFKKNIFFLALLSISASCSTKDNKVNSEPKEQTVMVNDKEQLKLDQIDNNTNLTVLKSLSYNNNAGSRVVVRAYLDENNKETKIEEEFTDVQTGNYGTFHYYIENGRPFATKQVYFDNQLKKPSFVERVVFYNQKGEAVSSKEKVSEKEEELLNLPFVKSKPEVISIDRAMRVLNQQGEFQTTFQGFLSSGGNEFILVGENTPDGFTTALVVQFEFPGYKKLKANERAMIGTPMEVQHQFTQDQSGMTLQVLTDAKLK